MGQYTEKAKELRPLIEKAAAQGLTDTEALEAVALFPTWQSGVSYNGAGDNQSKVRYKDTLYKCLQSHTSQDDWTPDTAVSLWVRMDDPAIECPEWVQPTGAHDAYEKGAKVSHNGKHWTNTIDNNVYEPGVYGWDEVA